MGKKGYNWKAREVVKTVIDDSKTKKITVEINDKNNYDACNALVLPSQKRSTKIKRPEKQVTRILSKKQRKHLEKIVEKKKKKENRSTLLENLSKVQATSEELNQLTSIASLQTKGLKKYFLEQNAEEKPKRKREVVEIDTVINSVAGSKKLRVNLSQNYENTDISDPNVVGLDESETSDSNSDVETIKNDVKSDKIDEEIVEKCEKLEENDVEIVESPQKTVKSLPKPAIFIPVMRSKSIQTARLKLPILAEEQQIMETIQEHSVVLIAGETGSGKTTQIPQFLYEAGFAEEKLIGVTEPRRVAAIAMSKRVGEEMNLQKNVSYLIRFEGNVDSDTKIKFMTDGVLLKEIQTDFLLTKYSVVILDEAHERSVYTDILIGLLSRIVPLRNKRNNPLKLIIMSATLRLTDFTDNSRLFKTSPPVIKIDARQFPVTIHFNKRTPDDYVKEAFNKCVKIHTKLPDGAILIFVTGQNEVNRLVKKLRRTFPMKTKDKRLEKPSNNTESSDSDSEIDENLRKSLRNKKKTQLPDINLDDYGMPEDDDVEDIDGLSSDEETTQENLSVYKNCQPLWTLPLYSLLPNKKQSKVFDQPPIGCRLCVVSTNVAETSLTIPGVKYVIDTGKSKQKLYDKVTGVSSYQVNWTSKASADQRAGRAGRISPGHCYRLFSSAVFQSFQQFSVPEIRQKPVDDLYLQMKCMNIDKIVNFPFPTAPDLLQLKMAESRLEILGALKDKHVTPLGKAISRFPVLPRFGKMLALSHQHNLLPYTICMVAALSVQEVLLETPISFQNVDQAKALRQKWIQLRRKWAGFGNNLLLGDPLVLLKAVGAAEYSNHDNRLEKFCDENGLRHKAIIEIRKLRFQLTNEIKLNVPECEIIVDPKLEPPTNQQAKLLRQILLAGMGDQVARRVSQDEIKENEDKIKYKYAYRAMDMEQPVFIHSNSVLKKSLPEFVIYQELYETNKLYMRGVTAIEPNWLPIYVPHLCNLSEPLLDPEPKYDSNSGRIYCTVTGTFGRQAWQLPPVEIEFPKTIDLYKWFAKFLLDGKIFDKLEKYVKILLSPSKTMVKSWAKLQPRTDTLLKTLISKDVHTKEILKNIWEVQPTFLLQEYKKWLPESAHNDITLIWPPV